MIRVTAAMGEIYCRVFSLHGCMAICKICASSWHQRPSGSGNQERLADGHGEEQDGAEANAGPEGQVT